MSGSVASLEQYTSASGGSPTQTSARSDQVLLDLRGLPDLPRCGTR